jgi:GAF domain-containing protein
VSGEELRALAEEQAALRRVATLVARRVSPQEVFAAVTEEVGRLLSAEVAAMGRYEPDGVITVVAIWGRTGQHIPIGRRWDLAGKNISTLVFETGRPARIDNYVDASGPLGDIGREEGFGSGVGTPVIVEGRPWGVMATYSPLGQLLPADTEARLANFTELVATSIANAHSRAQLALLAEQQAALRRVATLVARRVSPDEVFAAVTEEAVQLLSVEYAHLGRYESDDTINILAASGRTVDLFPVGRRWSLGGRNTSTLVFETGRPARIDSFADASGPLGISAREDGVGSGVGTPIIVEGLVWGVLAVGSVLEKPLPADIEARLDSFTELVATAIANAESRAELARLAEEQAALRRVATLVARGTPPDEVFASVTAEAGLLLGADLAGMARYEGDDTLTVLATWAAEDEHGGAHPLVPGPWPIEGGDLASTVWRTGRPVRIDTYEGVAGPIAAFVRDELGIGASVASPIVVDGRLWGVLFLHSKQNRQPFAPDTESRLTGFTELVGTAIANTESRAGLARLAEEQAALRRVATLVANATPPDELFAAVVEEVARLLPAEFAAMGRYESDGAMTCVATSSQVGERFPVGSRWTLEGKNVSALVAQTGRPARIDSYADATGSLGTALREEGIGSAVGTPVIVEGCIWGVMTARSRPGQSLSADSEARLANFTELVATAIANAESRGELMASRARIVAAADDTRRRIERDLHDGTQQRLVSLGLELRAAQATVPPQFDELDGALSRVVEELASMFDELREISHGIHPAILSKGGLQPALNALRRRSVLPVQLNMHVEQPLPEPVEEAAYYVVSEALANTAKHAQASVVKVELDTHDSVLQLAIRDNGIGGADLSAGSGLVGLSDRIEVLGGTFQVTSPAGKGTTLLIEIPLDGQSSSVSPERSS